MSNQIPGSSVHETSQGAMQTLAQAARQQELDAPPVSESVEARFARYIPIAVASATHNGQRMKERIEAARESFRPLFLQSQDSTRPLRARLMLLRRAVAVYNDAAQGLGACTKGCSHCCSMPTSVSRAEAQMIGQAIGVKPASPPLQEIVQDLQWGLNRGPCPFLRQGMCSIYAHRPLGCMVHRTFADDARLCELRVNHAVEMPVAEVQTKLEERFNFVYAVIGLQSGGFAELAQWFPKGRGTAGK